MFDKCITRVVQESILDGIVSAQDLAKKIKKPYSTLLREINPYDKGAKLGVETLLEIMRTTGNVNPLRHMAEELGYKVVPVGEKTTVPARETHVPETVYDETPQSIFTSLPQYEVEAVFADSPF